MAQQQAQHQKVMEMHEDIYLGKQLSVLKEGHILGQHFSVVRMAATIDLSSAWGKQFSVWGWQQPLISAVLVVPHLKHTRLE